MNNNQPIINLEEITFGYPGQKIVLDNLNLKFHKGDRVGLLGSNGSGKTTLLHIIMGLLKPLSGKIEVFGEALTKKKDFRNIYRKIGFLFQDADDQLFCPTVLEDVAFGPLNLNKKKDEAIMIAKKTLDYLGLSGFENRITHKLSGGEKKLVSLATVLAMGPETLLLDEPSSGLDDATKKKLAGILKDLNIPYILISHEKNFMAGLTNKIYTINDGKLSVNNKTHAHLHTHPHISH